jgi:hypothetical protein
MINIIFSHEFARAQAVAEREAALRAAQLDYTDAAFLVELAEAKDLAAPAAAAPTGARMRMWRGARMLKLSVQLGACVPGEGRVVWLRPPGRPHAEKSGIAEAGTSLETHAVGIAGCPAAGFVWSEHVGSHGCLGFLLTSQAVKNVSACMKGA